MLWHFGIRDNLFDARVYISRAEFFLSNGRFEAVDYLFYAVPILLLAFFKWVHADGIVLFIVFQCLLSGAATFMLYRSSSKLFNSNLAGLASAVIFLCWWENLQWNTVVMTESIACSVTCFVIHTLTYFKGTDKNWVVLFLLCGLCFFIRPTGVIIITAIVVFLLSRYWHALILRPALMIGVFSILLVAACFVAAFMLSHWDFTEQYKRGNIVTYMDTLEGKSLYDDDLRMDTKHLELPDSTKPPVEKIIYFTLHNPLHFLQAAFLKVFYLLSGTRPYFSALHNFYTVLWLGLLYILFYAGYKAPVNRSVKLFSLTIIIVNCALIAIATVDWDNRFYVPMVPGIALLSGGGGVRLLELKSGRTGA